MKLLPTLSLFCMMILLLSCSQDQSQEIVPPTGPLSVEHIVKTLEKYRPESGDNLQRCFEKFQGRAFQGMGFSDESPGNIPTQMLGLGYPVRLDTGRRANKKQIYIVIYVSKSEAESLEYRQQVHCEGTFDSVEIGPQEYYFFIISGHFS